MDVFFASQTGTSKEFAAGFAKAAGFKFGITATVHDLGDAGTGIATLSSCSLAVFLVSTYQDGQPPDSCLPFFMSLEDAIEQPGANNVLTHMRYSVFGFGHSDYESAGNFNKVARDLAQFLETLGAVRLLPLELGDEAAASTGVTKRYERWQKKVFAVLPAKGLVPAPVTKHQQKDSSSVAPTADSGDEDSDNGDGGHRGAGVDDNNDDAASTTSAKDIDDMEDAANGMNPQRGAMLNSRLRQALSKQGYKLIGSHSGVKLCRWTKAMLRGRGGCYKHTMYGISSYQCMEMTPSLACANKCVFCWRHHTNPVTKEWRWISDDPDFIVEAAVSAHRGLIKTMRGVAGVKPDRVIDGMNVRHCALSLVGEPIIYPGINRLLNLLHERKISTFLVTNAQFPDKMDTLTTVTQLYVSIDAATKEALKEVDRPLFEDFWERFLASIDSLARKGQRTVFRLTLVAGWNMSELENYAKLVKRGNPDFIEIKGVTYCGTTSSGAGLTMQNVPYHADVVQFGLELAAIPDLNDEYVLACEHEHSCCILLVHRRFFMEGKWHTWIDFDKFLRLVDSGEPFSSTDYALPTPEWALFGNEHRGFDPAETRHRRRGRHTAVREDGAARGGGGGRYEEED